MNAVEVLRAARAAGVRVGVLGRSLELDANRAPPDELLEELRRFKPEILALLSKQAPEFGATVQGSACDSAVESGEGVFGETSLNGYTMEQLEDAAGEDWAEIRDDPALLEVFARAVAARLSRERGERPPGWTARSHCARCGPVFLWPGSHGCVLACPWCFNRVAGLPIPRPHPVTCGNCLHFRRTDHAHLGHCARGQPGAPAGLWDTDRRACARWHPQEQTRGGPHGQ